LPTGHVRAKIYWPSPARKEFGLARPGPLEINKLSARPGRAYGPPGPCRPLQGTIRVFGGCDFPHFSTWHHTYTVNALDFKANHIRVMKICPRESSFCRMQLIEIFNEIMENECVNESHPLVKGVNLTDTARSLENGAISKLVTLSDLEWFMTANTWYLSGS